MKDYDEDRKQNAGSIAGRGVEPAKVIDENHLRVHYKGTRKEGQVEVLENIKNSDEIPDEANVFDEFDNMAARDWVKALITSENNRKTLDKLNNQIQTVPTSDYIQMFCGIEMLADLLGAELHKMQSEDELFSYIYFDFKGKQFFQFVRIHR